MLKVRIIPTLLWKDFGFVKGVAFDSWRRVGAVLPAIKVYNSRDVDELVLVDITATQGERSPDLDSVTDFSEECSVPLTVGGGVTTLQDITMLLRAGADKISINTAMFERPNVVEQAANRFGAQCIVVSIDVRKLENGVYSVFSHSGRQDTGRDPFSWARAMVDRGAGEILLTSIDRDGTMQGYDLELIERISSSVEVPVIASGGAGTYEHLIAAIKEGGASAVAAASMFHFTEQTPAAAKQALGAAGIPVRHDFVPL